MDADLAMYGDILKETIQIQNEEKKVLKKEQHNLAKNTVVAEGEVKRV